MSASPATRSRRCSTSSGCSPASVEYYWRYSESLTELYNIINLWGFGPQFWEAFTALALQASGEELLQRLGASGAQPDILQHVVLQRGGARSRA